MGYLPFVVMRRHLAGLFTMAVLLVAIVATATVAVNQETDPVRATAPPSPLLWLDATNTASYPGSGTTWSDLSGNASNGALTGSVTYNSANKSMNFSGSGHGTAYVDLAGNFTDFSGGLTLEFEGHFGSTTTAWERIFDIAGAAVTDPPTISANHNSIWVGRLETQNEIVVETWNGNQTSGYCHTATDGTALAGGAVFEKWLLTISTNSAEPAPLCRIFRNGAELPTRITSAWPPVTSSAGANPTGSPYVLPPIANRELAYIGRSNWQQDGDLEGAIRYIRIYDQALTPAEALANATATVAFAPNGGLGSMSPQSSTISATLNPSTFTKAGYTFDGWNTAANGSGLDYADAGSFPFSSDATLYAQWRKNITGPTSAVAQGLVEFARFEGRYRFSADGMATASAGTGTLQIDYPAGATLSAAFLTMPSKQLASGTPALSTTATLNGTSVSFTHSARDRATNPVFWNRFADVTDIIRSVLNGSTPGTTVNVPASYARSSLSGHDNEQGLALTVFFEDPTQPTGVTIFQFGHARTTGETITLSFPPLSAAPASVPLSVGIGWGFQELPYGTGTGLSRDGYNFIDVKTSSSPQGTRLSGFSGGCDDSIPCTGRAQTSWDLITVGGVGDSLTNPSGAWVNYRSDDELYDLAPFLTAGDTSLSLETLSPSNDDTILQVVATFAGIPGLSIGTDPTVTFVANGGTGSMNPQASSVSATLTPNTFTRGGFTFSGWNTAADGSGTSYADGAAYPFTSSTTLYAQWTMLPLPPLITTPPTTLPPAFTITFDANGGAGTMSAQSATASATLSPNSFTRAGFTFIGWNTATNGSGTPYADGASYPFTSSTTLYAQWQQGTSTTTPSTSPLVPNTAGPTSQPPAPASNDDGVLPEVQPGAVEVSEAGIAVPAEVTVEGTSAVVLRGQDFELRLTGDCTSGCTVTDDETGRETIYLESNGSARVEGFGFKPGSPVYVWVFSNPRYLGALTVRDDGTFDGSFPLGDLEAGDHTLQVSGVSADDLPRAANLGIVVRDTAPPTPQPESLPATGNSPANAIALALLLMTLGIVALGRRRTSITR